MSQRKRERTYGTEKTYKTQKRCKVARSFELLHLPTVCLPQTSQQTVQWTVPLLCSTLFISMHHNLFHTWGHGCGMWAPPFSLKSFLARQLDFQSSYLPALWAQRAPKLKAEVCALSLAPIPGLILWFWYVQMRTLCVSVHLLVSPVARRCVTSAVLPSAVSSSSHVVLAGRHGRWRSL